MPTPPFKHELLNRLGWLKLLATALLLLDKTGGFLPLYS